MGFDTYLELGDIDFDEAYVKILLDFSEKRENIWGFGENIPAENVLEKMSVQINLDITKGWICLHFET